MTPIEQTIELYRRILRTVPIADSSLIGEIECAITALQSMQGEAAQERLLARNQPCGCVVCYCENEDQCQGCGAKNCGTHPFGEMPSPLYPHPPVQPKVPDGVIDLLKAAQGAIRLDQPDTAHVYIGAVIDVLASQEQEQVE